MKNSYQAILNSTLTAFFLCAIPFIWIWGLVPSLDKIEPVLTNIVWNNNWLTFKSIIFHFRFILLFVTLMQIFHLMGGFFLGLACKNINLYLQISAFEKIQTLPVEFFRKRGESEIAQQISQYSRGLITFLSLFFMYILPNLFGIIFTIFKHQFQQSLFLIGWVILFAIPFIPTLWYLIKSNSKAIEAEIATIGCSTDIYKNIFLEKTLKIQNSTKSRFIGFLERESDKWQFVTFFNGFTKAFLGQISVLFFVFYIILNIFLNKKFVLSHFSLGWHFHHQIWQILVTGSPLFYFWTQYNRSKKAIFNNEEEKNGNINISVINSIEVKDLNFSYDGKEIFKNFNFKFERGLTFLKGPSGSGKSTLVLLILGLLKAKGVFINGIDINEINRDSISNHVTFMYQNNLIFNTTVLENLKLIDRSDANWQNICKSLSIDDLLNRECGPGGVNLSGGQQKRINFARVLGKDRVGNVVILDEPFTFLDDILKIKFKEIINQWRNEGRFVIVVNHEYEYDHMADHILQIQKIPDKKI